MLNLLSGYLCRYQKTPSEECDRGEKKSPPQNKKTIYKFKNMIKFLLE